MLCVGAGIPRAFAEQSSERGTSIKVKFGDLNLADPVGIETLYKRIERAARQVCDVDASPSDPLHTSHWRYCYRTAVSNAVRDVNNQKLTAMYREKNKPSTAG
jgi:UrcA family protein